MSPHALAFPPGLFVLPNILAILHIRRKIVGIPIQRLLALILLGGPVFGLFAVSGYVHAPPSRGLLFASVAVFVTGSILGPLLLHKRVSTSRLTGAAVVFVGLATLVGLDLGGPGATWMFGMVLFVLTDTMWEAYTVLLRLWQVPVIEGTLAVASGSALILVPVLGVVIIAAGFFMSLGILPSKVGSSPQTATCHSRAHRSQGSLQHIT